MQEPIFPSTLTQKLYRERAILIATFVGGPLAGGFLIARNFQALDEPAKAGKTWMVTIAVILALFGSLFVPAMDKIPSVVYSFAFCFAAHFIAKKYQGSSIELHMSNGGQVYSTWRAVLVGLISFVLLFSVGFGIAYLQDLFVAR